MVCCPYADDFKDATKNGKYLSASFLTVAYLRRGFAQLRCPLEYESLRRY
jgi:hypothetical protein